MKSIMLAFVFSGFYPAHFSYAEDGLPSGVLKSTGADRLEQAVKSASPVPAVKAGYYQDMVLVPEGEFIMGSEEKGYPNEHPRHKVFLDAYFIDKFEVTVAQYRLFAAAAGLQLPRQTLPSKDNYPVVRMTWHDATAYCSHYGKQLPTEAQWEKAAGGGSDGKFCFGNDEAGLGEYAWYWVNSGTQIHPVGRKKPNRYGIYDMHGNVLEWTADWYGGKYYAEGPARNPQGPVKGEDKVIRGGSAFVSAELCRSSARMRSSPDTPYSGKGFRCAAPVPAKPPP